MILHTSNAFDAENSTGLDIRFCIRMARLACQHRTTAGISDRDDKQGDNYARYSRKSRILRDGFNSSKITMPTLTAICRDAERHSTQPKSTRRTDKSTCRSRILLNPVCQHARTCSKVCITPRIRQRRLHRFHLGGTHIRYDRLKEFTDGVSTLTAADTFAALETCVR